MADQALVAQPWVVMSGHTPVAMSWSTASRSAGRAEVGALHPVVRPDGHVSAAELPADEVPARPARLAEEPCVVLGQALGILGTDQDAVQVQAAPPGLA